MEVSLSSEFGSRIEALLKELVAKTTQAEHEQRRADLTDRLAPLDARLARLERRVVAMEAFRATSLDLLTRMLGELSSTQPAVDEPRAPMVDASTGSVDRSWVAERDPVTIDDVQRFLMQRLPSK